MKVFFSDFIYIYIYIAKIFSILFEADTSLKMVHIGPLSKE